MLSKLFFTRLIIFIFLILFFIHLVAIYFSLYWIVDWLDIVMHFLGGIWLALIAIWLFYFSGKMNVSGISFGWQIFFLVGVAALGGVLWEFFEFGFDNLFLHNFEEFKILPGCAQLGVADTMSDLFFDLLGGLIGGLIFLKKIKNNEK
ncbi:MAG: hypothetical protein ABIJ28_03675 [Patescibacteria group bacterium]